MKLKDMKSKLVGERASLKNLNAARTTAEKNFKAKPTAHNGKMFTSATTAWKNQFLKVEKLAAAVANANEGK